MTDKQNKLIPKLRFPEFKNDGEWEQKFVKDVCSIETGKSNTQDQDVNGLYPFFIRSENPVKSSKYLYDCEAVITIGDGKIGQVFHYINGKFDLHQRCYKMSDFQGVNGKYFFYFFSSHFYERAMRMSAKATVDSVRLEMISDMPIYLPSLKEQKRIAEFLTSLDDLLTGTKSILEQLRVHKKGLMQKLFPAPGKTLPEYRFREFRESFDWSFRPGDELFRPIVNKSPDSILPILAITQDHGAIPRELIDYKVIVSDKSVAGYKVVDIGDFIISLRSFQGGIEYSRFKGLCSPAYIVFRKKTPNICDDFYRFYFKSDRFVLDLNRNIEGIRDGKIVSFQQFSEIAIPCPSFDEQMRIAQSLSSIDELINKYSAKLSFLMDFKKGLLQRVLI